MVILTVKVLASLLSGEVLLSLHGLALLSLLRVATMLLAVVFLAVMLPASMLTSVSHYNITQEIVVRRLNETTRKNGCLIKLIG